MEPHTDSPSPSLSNAGKDALIASLSLWYAKQNAEIVELRALVDQLQGQLRQSQEQTAKVGAEKDAEIAEIRSELAEQQRLTAAQRDEIARLKKAPGRPKLKPNAEPPSGMERETNPKKDKKPGRGEMLSKIRVTATETIKARDVPPGSRFPGFTSYTVQDLKIEQTAVEYRCERWQAPDGKVITAPLPVGTNGHFGPELRRYVLMQYHQGQTTVERCWPSSISSTLSSRNVSSSAC